MNNKKLGTAFEREFCKLLASKGFWVHFMSPSSTGSQPCDIIACKDNIPYLIDCKTSVDKTFHLNRLEDNQICAFYKFGKCGNKNQYIAVKYDDKVYFIPYEILKEKNKVVLDDRFLFR